VSDQTLSKVWILSGVTGSQPALLSHEAGQVTLSTFSDEDEPVQSFSVKTADISDVKFPAYQLSGGCSFVANSQKYRISFLQPQNTKLPTYFNELSGVAEIGSGRKAGKAWKKILSA
jgi:hypothetical protein